MGNGYKAALITCEMVFADETYVDFIYVGFSVR